MWNGGPLVVFQSKSVVFRFIVWTHDDSFRDRFGRNYLHSLWNLERSSNVIENHRRRFDRAAFLISVSCRAIGLSGLSYGFHNINIVHPTLPSGALS